MFCGHRRSAVGVRVCPLGDRSVIPEQLVDRMRCPECGDPGVECGAGHRFAVRDGYLDCSTGSVLVGSTDRTFASFGIEWNNFDDVRDEDEGPSEVHFRDVDLASLDGLCGLDAGCGKGRYTRFLAAYFGTLAALDGSSAVEAAPRNLAEFPTVAVVKSDLRAAPFAPGSFDFITSLGVLHYLDDPRAGFDRLATYLAPGGRILLYLYSRPRPSGSGRWPRSWPRPCGR